MGRPIRSFWPAWTEAEETAYKNKEGEYEGIDAALAETDPPGKEFTPQEEELYQSLKNEGGAASEAEFEEASYNTGVNAGEDAEFDKIASDPSYAEQKMVDAATYEKYGPWTDGEERELQTNGGNLPSNDDGRYSWNDTDEGLLKDFGAASENDHAQPEWTEGAGTDADHPSDETLYQEYGVAQDEDYTWTDGNGNDENHPSDESLYQEYGVAQDTNYTWTNDPDNHARSDEYWYAEYGLPGAGETGPEWSQAEENEYQNLLKEGASVDDIKRKVGYRMRYRMRSMLVESDDYTITNSSGSSVTVENGKPGSGWGENEIVSYRPLEINRNGRDKRNPREKCSWTAVKAGEVTVENKDAETGLKAGIVDGDTAASVQTSAEKAFLNTDTSQNTSEIKIKDVENGDTFNMQLSTSKQDGSVQRITLAGQVKEDQAPAHTNAPPLLTSPGGKDLGVKQEQKADGSTGIDLQGKMVINEVNLTQTENTSITRGSDTTVDKITSSEGGDATEVTVKKEGYQRTKDSSRLTVTLSFTEATWTGKEIMPEVVSVTDAVDGELEKKAYTVKYSNNTDAGDGKVIVDAFEYQEPVEATFTIKKKDGGGSGSGSGGNNGGSSGSGGGSSAQNGTFYTSSGGTITDANGNSVTVSVKATIPKTSAEYTGKKITAKSLGAEVDLSSLGAAADMFLKKGDSSKLFKTTWVTSKNKDAGTAKYYAKISFKDDKAKKWGMKDKYIREFKKIIKALNKDLKANKLEVTITPVDLSKNNVEAKGSFKKEKKKYKLSLKYVKVELGGRMKKLSSKYYKIVEKNREANTVTIRAKGKNFTGETTVTLS